MHSPRRWGGGSGGESWEEERIAWPVAPQAGVQLTYDSSHASVSSTGDERMEIRSSSVTRVWVEEDGGEVLPGGLQLPRRRRPAAGSRVRLPGRRRQSVRRRNHPHEQHHAVQRAVWQEMEALGRDTHFSTTVTYRIDPCTGVVQHMEHVATKRFGGKEEIETSVLSLRQP